jgi:hypothetical protein
MTALVNHKDIGALCIKEILVCKLREEMKNPQADPTSTYTSNRRHWWWYAGDLKSVDGDEDESDDDD